MTFQAFRYDHHVFGCLIVHRPFSQTLRITYPDLLLEFDKMPGCGQVHNLPFTLPSTYDPRC